MSSWVKKIIVVVLVCIFVFSIGSIAATMYEYRQIDKSYEDAADKFVQAVPTPTAVPSAPGLNDDAQSGDDAPDDTEPVPEYELAPMMVDFAALKEVNSDIVGWIYCEDTVINYPILHGTDNDFYLNHMYDSVYNKAGSIFVDAANRPFFQDGQTIIYGHNMRSDAMFGTLEKWGEQEYYEEHPVFWLITPEQDYRIEVLGAYETSALSDTYVIYQGTGPELREYIDRMLEKSAITATEQPEDGAHYVLLSTCSYSYSNARFVIHGRLTPVDSAGGVLKES